MPFERRMRSCCSSSAKRDHSRNAITAGSPASTGRNRCGSVRSPPAATRASRRSSFAPARLTRSRSRSRCLGLIAYTAKPRSRRASRTGPCGTSMATATEPGSPAIDTSQSHRAARPAPPCMPARYVKPYVQRGKSDALDAEAICEAVSRPTMRFAAMKSVEQQSALTQHRTREILVKQETMLANLMRGCPGEFGIVAPLGIRRVAELIAIVRDENDARLPAEARSAMVLVARQLEDLQRRIRELERAIHLWHRQNEATRRLATIPGVGPITASAVVATVGNVDAFKSARHFAAFLGLTPKEHSTGGKQRLGRISKQGDIYIRRLLILGGTALVRYARGAGGTAWAKQLLARRPARVVTVALANKAARIIWAVLTRGGVYRSAAPQAA